MYTKYTPDPYCNELINVHEYVHMADYNPKITFDGCTFYYTHARMI